MDAMEHLKSKMIRNKNRNIICVDLYVIRHTKTRLLASSAPCLHCTSELSKIKWLKINNRYAKKLLVKLYRINIDYNIKKINETTGSGGHNKKIYYFLSYII